MTGMLVDSSVLLDVSTQDPTWFEWSASALAHAVRSGPVLLNPIIYAEVSVGYDRIEDLDDALPAEIFLPVAAAVCRRASWPAGIPGLSPPRRPRTSPLPDFFIGAHAAVSDWAC